MFIDENHDEFFMTLIMICLGIFAHEFLHLFGYCVNVTKWKGRVRWHPFYAECIKAIPGRRYQLAMLLPFLYAILMWYYINSSVFLVLLVLCVGDIKTAILISRNGVANKKLRTPENMSLGYEVEESL